MWAYHHKDKWGDLDKFAIPTLAGRRLDVGGFMLGDSFELFLKSVSKEYLRQAWNNLQGVLSEFEFDIPQDLSWGMFHPGEAYNLSKNIESPLDFIGFLSQELENFFTHPDFRAIDDRLKSCSPSLRCISSWRSLKWDIQPNDFDLSLRLIEALTTDEISNWSPSNPTVLIDDVKKSHWRQMARCISINDQQGFENAVANSKKSYSKLGFKIICRAYDTYLSQLDDYNQPISAIVFNKSKWR